MAPDRHPEPALLHETTEHGLLDLSAHAGPDVKNLAGNFRADNLHAL